MQKEMTDTIAVEEGKKVGELRELEICESRLGKARGPLLHWLVY